jgi:hypothetical protein
MDISTLQQIEAAEGVTFALRPDTKVITCTGKTAAVDRALAAIAPARDKVAALLRERQGMTESDEPVVERQIALNILSLDVQRENYIRWFKARPLIFQPNESELDKMFAACAEGDEIFFDFTQSFTVRKPNGLFISIDRKGRVDQPSPYAPVVMQQQKSSARKEKEN